MRRNAPREPKAAVKKPPAKRKSRAKVAKEVRLKAFWGVFNQSLRRIAVFEYSQRADADKKAADLTESQKTPAFCPACEGSHRRVGCVIGAVGT